MRDTRCVESRIYGVSFAGICFAGFTETRNQGTTESCCIAAESSFAGITNLRNIASLELRIQEFTESQING